MDTIVGPIYSDKLIGSPTVDGRISTKSFFFFKFISGMIVEPFVQGDILYGYMIFLHKDLYICDEFYSINLL